MVPWRCDDELLLRLWSVRGWVNHSTARRLDAESGVAVNGSVTRTWVIAGAVVLGIALVAGASGWWLGARSAPDSIGSIPSEEELVDSETANKVRTDPLFKGPDDLGRFIASARQSTVTVLCDGGSGAGWIIDTEAKPKVRPAKRAEYGDEYTRTVVSAEHVIADCRDSNDELSVQVGSTTVPAALMHWDKQADLATIGISANSPAVRPYSFASGGNWTMTLGAPVDGVLVPLIGPVIDENEVEILVQMPTLPGNSGGPLFNSRGEVIGTIGGTLLDAENGTPVG